MNITRKTLSPGQWLCLFLGFMIGVINPFPSTANDAKTITNSLSSLEGLSSNQKAVAQALDTACKGAIGKFAQDCNGLFFPALTDDERRDALTQIIPDEIPAQGTTLVRMGTVQLSNLQDRLLSLRDGNGGISLFGLALNVEGQAVPLGKFTQNWLTQAAGDNNANDGPLGVFLQGKISMGAKDQTKNERGFQLETDGLTLGTDYRLTEKLVLGTAIGYANTSTEFGRTGSHMDTESAIFALYGSYYLPKDFYIDGIFNYGLHDYELSRKRSFRDMNTTATSKPHGNQYGWGFNVGKDIHFKELFVNSYAHFEYLKVGIDRYQEKNNTGPALAIDDQSIHSLAATLGGQMGWPISMSWGTLTPGACFEWGHQYSDHERRIGARFIDAPLGTPSFAVMTDQPDRNYFNGSASLAATFTEGRSGFIRYENRIGQNNVSHQAIELGLRVSF